MSALPMFALAVFGLPVLDLLVQGCLLVGTSDRARALVMRRRTLFEPGRALVDCPQGPARPLQVRTSPSPRRCTPLLAIVTGALAQRGPSPANQVLRRTLDGARTGAWRVGRRPHAYDRPVHCRPVLRL